MYWNRTTTGTSAVREEMPLSSISHVASTPTAESVNPGTNAQITSTCCTPPPSYHNINLPLGHPSTLTNERGEPPSYEEAIDPNGILECLCWLLALCALVACCLQTGGLSFFSATAVLRFVVRSYARGT